MREDVPPRRKLLEAMCRICLEYATSTSSHWPRRRKKKPISDAREMDLVDLKAVVRFQALII